MGAVQIILALANLLQQGAPVINELFNSLSLLKTAQDQGRDLTQAELDTLDTHRDAAFAKFEADINVRASTGGAAAP